MKKIWKITKKPAYFDDFCWFGGFLCNSFNFGWKLAQLINKQSVGSYLDAIQMTLIGGSCWLNKGHPLETTTYKNLNKSWNCPWLRIWILLWLSRSKIFELWDKSTELRKKMTAFWPFGKVYWIPKKCYSFHQDHFEWKYSISNSYFEPQTSFFLHFLFRLLQLHKFCKCLSR